MTALGFVELSVGNHAEALITLQPLIDAFGVLPRGEMRNLEYVPYAIEALIATGRADEAEPMIEQLENDGRRLDRPWLLATGARGPSDVVRRQGRARRGRRVPSVTRSRSTTGCPCRSNGPAPCWCSGRCSAGNG